MFKNFLVILLFHLKMNVQSCIHWPLMEGKKNIILYEVSLVLGVIFHTLLSAFIKTNSCHMPICLCDLSAGMSCPLDV